MASELRGYRIYDDGAVEELGPVPTARLAELLAQAQAAIPHRAYAIGLYRDRRDFLEARPRGRDEFAFRSDRLHRDSLLSRLSGRDAGLAFDVHGVEQAVAAFVCYAGLPRDAFERKAEDFPKPRR